MAKVNNVRLTIGPGVGDRQSAEVSYDIEFTATELKLNIRFDEVAVLYERDDELDIYEEVLGGDMLIARGNSTANDSEVDDQIGIIGHASVAPEGRPVVRRQMRADWFFPANEKGPEEYRALIWVLPEIRRGSAWSNEVVVNLT